MAAADLTAGGNAEVVPVACTLSRASLAEQAERWHRLLARAMTSRTETEHGLRVCFRAEPGAEEELRSLAAVETECCRWADWAVQAREAQLVLEVRSTGTGIGTLHDMFRPA